MKCFYCSNSFSLKCLQDPVDPQTRPEHSFVINVTSKIQESVVRVLKSLVLSLDSAFQKPIRAAVRFTGLASHTGEGPTLDNEGLGEDMFLPVSLAELGSTLTC